MTTISFYARGDSSSANNAALNVKNQSQQATTLLTFDSGPTGDIILEYNGGANDPDTTVIINGTNYNFKVELTGGLPLNNGKTPDPLEGKTVTVISVVIGGATKRFFFVNDGSGTQTLMNQFGNGAIALTNANFAPPPVYICFCGGTDISTPTGYRKVESLAIGDLVLNDQGQAKPILWIGRTDVSFEEMKNAPERRPFRIAADAIKPGVPFADLQVSAQHRIVLEGNDANILFAEQKLLVAAKHLEGSIAERVLPSDGTTYFHLLLEDHDLVVSNGLASESYQPSPRGFAGMSRDAQGSLASALTRETLQRYFRRPDAIPSLKAHEAKLLAGRMFGKRLGRGLSVAAFAARPSPDAGFTAIS